MGNTYFPNDIFLEKLNNLIQFTNHSLVQFYHRNLAYFILFYFLILSIYIYKNNLKYLFRPLILVIISLLLQIILGIFTLLSGLDIYLASAHQLSSVILVFTAINLYYYQVLGRITKQ